MRITSYFQWKPILIIKIIIAIVFLNSVIINPLFGQNDLLVNNINKYLQYPGYSISKNYGFLDQENISLNIMDLRPWWFSELAIGIYLAIVACLVFMYTKLVIQRRREQQKALEERKEKEEISKLNKARLELFTEIAHDFRTPLNLITGPIEQLSKYHSKDKNFERLLGLISRNAKRLNYLSEELMTFRALETGQLMLKKEKTDFIEYIQQIIQEYLPLIKRKNIKFCLNYDNIAFILPIDKRRMERVICNLLDNAIKYTSEYGEIRIDIQIYSAQSNSIKEQQKHLIIKFFNSGEPFSDEEIKKIFDRFYQGNNLTRPGSGYGIGLSLIKGIVELHSGTISVRNIRNEGNEFIIHLPNVLPKSDKKSLVYKPIDLIQEYSSSSHPIIEKRVSVGEYNNQENVIEIKNKNKPLILIVEDNIEFKEYLGSRLKRKFNIHLAGDGSRGFEFALKKMPDLIISDIMMPVMNGLELCARIKEDLRTCHIPVILLTSKSEMDHRIRGLETGADAYLSKPFVFEHLDTQIDNLLKTRKVLAKKIKSTENIETEEVFSSKVDQDFINSAINFVRENINEESLGVDSLSDYLCVSRRHLYRKIKALTGFSPIEFINIIRLRRSMELLKENSRSISEIGYMVGFNNPSYFTQAFKKFYGHPPSYFAKKE